MEAPDNPQPGHGDTGADRSQSAYRRFVLTDDEVWAIHEASKPRLLTLEDQRTNADIANEAWQSVARKHGFVWDSVIPDPATRDKGTILAKPDPEYWRKFAVATGAFGAQGLEVVSFELDAEGFAIVEVKGEGVPLKKFFQNPKVQKAILSKPVQTEPVNRAQKRKLKALTKDKPDGTPQN